MNGFCKRMLETITLAHVAIFLFHITTIQCCYIADNKHICNSFEELYTDSASDWYQVYLYREKDKSQISLKNYTFSKTPNLETLQISAPISDIEVGAFSSLKKLDRLMIFNSPVEKISAELFDDLNIRYLQLYNNQQTDIPEMFFEKMPFIRHIDFRKNNFKEINLNVFNNTPLLKIYLDDNKIERIADGAFAGIDNLLDLGLSGNLLESFDSKLLFEESQSLTSLWLARNLITKLTKDTFTAVPFLRTLYIQNNKIDTIEDGTFAKLIHLDFLDISENQLKEIQPTILPATGFKDFRTLLMHGNKVTFINAAIFYRTPHLKVISYRGNPLQCGCFTQLRRLAAERKVTEVCKSYYSHNGNPICAHASLGSKTCIYDVELTEDVVTAYEKEVAKYPTINSTCASYDETLKAL